jgi:hypothetical protein
MPGMRSIEPAEPVTKEPMEVPKEPTTPPSDPKDGKPKELRLCVPEFRRVEPIVYIFYPSLDKRNKTGGEAGENQTEV